MKTLKLKILLLTLFAIVAPMALLTAQAKHNPEIPVTPIKPNVFTPHPDLMVVTLVILLPGASLNKKQ